MRRSGRPLAFVLLASAALFAAGCESNNKEKILGKWKLVESPGFNTPDGRMFVEMGLYAVVDFAPDGTMTISLESDNPGTMALLNRNAPGGKTKFTAKYRLGFGDNVEITDIDKDLKQFIKPGRWVVTINAGYMSVKTADGIEKYERISAYVAPQGGKAK